jgi:hypothetical protein
MQMFDRDLVNKYAVNSTILIMNTEMEAFLIYMVDDEEDIIYVEGEETGEDYMIRYDEINLDTAIWYRYQMLTPELINTL